MPVQTGIFFISCSKKVSPHSKIFTPKSETETMVLHIIFTLSTAKTPSNLLHAHSGNFAKGRIHLYTW